MSMRQNDGGWAIPTRTLGLPLKVIQPEANGLWNTGRNRPKHPYSEVGVGQGVRKVVAPVGAGQCGA
jgi:hypothetical protein